MGEEPSSLPARLDDGSEKEYDPARVEYELSGRLGKFRSRVAKKWWWEDDGDGIIPRQFEEAARLWILMEDGDLGDPKEWVYPPSSGKVSAKDIMLRLGCSRDEIENSIPSFRFLHRPEFQRYVDDLRAYREAVELPETFNASKVIRSIITESTKQILTRIHMTNMGFGTPLSEEMLFKELPRWLRLYSELEGKLETAGVSVGVINQYVNKIESPEARRRALELVSKSLIEQARDIADEDVIEMEEVEVGSK